MVIHPLEDKKEAADLDTDDVDNLHLHQSKSHQSMTLQQHWGIGSVGSSEKGSDVSHSKDTLMQASQSVHLSSNSIMVQQPWQDCK